STYLGGGGNDSIHGMSLDPASEEVVVCGSTASTNFPVTGGAFQTSFQGGVMDVFVTRLDAGGEALVFSTYLGGSGSGDARFGEFGYDIAVDGAGHAYITGLTDSPDFPTLNALQPALGGGDHDAFATKLSPDGSALVYSTYLGGSGNEEGLGIAVDADENAYLSGWTSSDDFPLENPVQPFRGGMVDAFALKLDPTGSALVYSTYLGGSNFDFSFDIAVHESGEAYIMGNTTSEDFPVTDPVQAILGGGSDSFVTKLSADGSTVIYATFLGGADEEELEITGFGIAVDAAGDAYLTGTTASNDFPTENPFQLQLGGAFDAYVAKISTGPVIRIGIENTGGQNELTITHNNGSADPREVEFKFWVELPNRRQSLLESPQLFVLPPLKTIQQVIPLPASIVFPGSTVGVRYLDPATGDILSESLCSTTPCN
ncbi:MAG: SBBP repeat-containing protein, partial [Planctomycetes bacterium]|nr:SBBP repeat-containing protein [Planctomycetota bacterium]